MNPWPRQFSFRVFVALATIAVALVLSVPRPVHRLPDLRDSVSERHSSIPAGHAAFACAACHFAHPAKAQRPLWQPGAGTDSTVFARDSQLAGGVKTGLCMSCHDGAVASSLASHGSSMGGPRLVAMGVEAGSNHPVGVDYMAAVRRDPGSYIDPSANPRIVLEDGKVGCMSCHATHDASSMGSVNLRPEVCIDCHVR